MTNINHLNDIRELKIDELEAVSGGDIAGTALATTVLGGGGVLIGVSLALVVKEAVTKGMSSY
jgi:hypothetical protein